MEDFEVGLDIRKYFFLLTKWWWLIVLCTLVSGGTAFLVDSAQPRIYEARATLVLQNSSNSLNNYILRSTQWEPETYKELLPVLLPETATRLKIGPIAPNNVTVERVTDSRVIYLKVRDTDPLRAAEIANTIPLVFDSYTESLLLDTYAEMRTSLSDEMKRVEADIAATQARIDALGQPASGAEQEELKRLQTSLSQYRYNYGQMLTSYEQVRLAETQSKGSMVIFKQATPPSGSSYPNTRRDVLITLVLGALLACAAILLIDYLDDTIKTGEDVTRVLGCTLLGTVAMIQPTKRGGEINTLIAHLEPRSPLSEAFRALRTNVRFASVDHPMKRLAVTSSKPSEGKSLVAANLAVVFAQAGSSVALIDCDLRRPKQHIYFDLPNQTGTTDCLVSDPASGLEPWLQPTEINNLHLMSSGALPPNPSELVGSHRMGQLIDQLAGQHDIVLLDTPPLLAVTDAALLSRQVDGVVLILAAGSTREKEARKAYNDLIRVGAPVLGVVLNKIPTSRHGEYGDEYYYAQYAYGDKKKKPHLWQKLLPKGFLNSVSHRHHPSNKPVKPA